ncbi:TPR-like protein [Sanghuangporus baumii]|uniref:TPR-like protein n=1 Tax=Sanghuangporus baumii TaxID=108892 RepID=A0A9Q5HW52_SANBA|nr:TPR-like protein [Sanghuangporus baumii]
MFPALDSSLTADGRYFFGADIKPGLPGLAALDYCPRGDSSHGPALHALAHLLYARYVRWEEVDDLERSIMLDRTVLELEVEGPLYRFLVLYGLACSFCVRFKFARRMKDPEETNSLDRVGLELRPRSQPYRYLSMRGLGNSLVARFLVSRRAEDLEEGISLLRAVLDLRPDKHLARIFAFVNLGVSLTVRFKHSGRMKDLEEAISLNRAALELREEGQPYHSLLFIELGRSLVTRFEHIGRVEDLDEGISLIRAALKLESEGHRDLSSTSSILGICLAKRFDHRGKVEDLEESISLHRAALELRQDGHPCRYSMLDNLGSTLVRRFRHEGRMEDLEEGISLLRAALELRLEDHSCRHLTLANLGRYLVMRFQNGGRTEDLEEGILLIRAALELLPDHFRSLTLLAKCLYVRYEKDGCTNDLEESIQSLRLAVFHPFSNFKGRLNAAYMWTTIARFHNHDSLTEAHRSAMSLLQRGLTAKSTLSEQHKFLCSDSRYRSLAVDAASHAIDKNEYTQAIEFLEQGRALLWSQMRGFRTSVEQLLEVNGPLAEIFAKCNRRLEALITCSEACTTGSSTSLFETRSHSPFYDQHSINETLAQMQQLVEQQEAIIDDIRQIPGFEDFLKAKPFNAIQQAVSEGPVIVLNHSQYRCDALIVLVRDNDPCVCVPLDKEFYTDAIDLREELIVTCQTNGVDSSKYDIVLRRVMKTLWDRIVSKAVRKLIELGIDGGSRIWWCPTSVLSSFPFHAAGPYMNEDGTEKYLLDDYISSYTPTLSSLICARSNTQNGDARLLFVGDTGLASTKKERDSIRRYRTVDIRLIDHRASRSTVIRDLKRVEWVHFVCHGRLDEEPFNSYLKLSDGGLTLLDIARANLPNAEFAYLSACHTAEQGPNFALDEVLHLAAGMQFCGFRSVVGTMWQLLDKDGPFLAGAVYGHVMGDLEEGEIRFKRAAEAVRQSALRLRERGDEGDNGEKVDIMAERWVNLVHIGA